MNTEEKRQLEELKKKVEELLKWKESREKQQLTHPLDKTTSDIIKNA